ncbi:ATP-binding protein [Chloroflexales bacterium ZM16-3]|nr:ATP-binding protein [Chloroflexales bacterium ZM16-3]
MKVSLDKWRVRWNDDTAFYSYRWLAWAVAGLSLTVPGRALDSLPRDAGILLLLGVITVAATAMAHGYVRLARRRPAVMLLDVLAGIAVVWLGGGGALPFLPYALGALVLPTLLGGWRTAIIAGVVFSFLDSSCLLLQQMSSGDTINLALVGFRAVAPLAFVCAWALLRQLLGHSEHPGSLAGQRQTMGGGRRAAGGDGSDHLLRLSIFADLESDASMRAGGAAAPQRTASQMEPAPRSEAARHAIFDPTPSEELSFPAEIDQLALNIGRQSTVAMQLTTLGAVRPLSGAQHSVLLRTAHEALLNINQHAHAHSAMITISFEPQAVTLAVQDDGVGLLDGTYERPGMHALRAVRYRLAELDGQLAVFEGESGGVTLRATLPLDA